MFYSKLSLSLTYFVPGSYLFCLYYFKLSLSLTDFVSYLLFLLRTYVFTCNYSTEVPYLLHQTFYRFIDCHNIFTLQTTLSVFSNLE